MLSHIRGCLISVDDGYAVIEAGGLGFSVKMASTAHLAKSTGKTVLIPVSLDMSGGEPVIIGFSSTAEKLDFEILVKIPGIGSATALRLLPLASRVKSGDISALDGVPGIGPSRRTKIAKWLKKSVDDSIGENATLSELRSALVALGMKTGEARAKAMKVFKRKPEATLEQLIRLSVKG